jgi:hypothetical protein
MSEATYTGGDAEKPPVDGGAGESGGTGGESRRSVGGLEVDTTYPRSIEGILKIITVVSRLETVDLHTASKKNFQAIFLNNIYSKIKISV